MGCDIHAYYERKINDKWESMHPNDWQSVTDSEDGMKDLPWELTLLNRDYWLFSMLARVQGEFEYSFFPKGMPDDVCTAIKTVYDSWAEDGHSHSFLTIKELKHKATELLLEPLTPHIENNINGLQKLIKQFPDVSLGDENYRIVFWFDN